MSYHVVQFEPTPNPNAMKCRLNRSISEKPLSFHNADDAADHPIASALFANAGITNVLFNGDWMTVNKANHANWTEVQTAVERVLSKAG